MVVVCKATGNGNADSRYQPCLTKNKGRSSRSKKNRSVCRNGIKRVNAQMRKSELGDSYDRRPARRPRSSQPPKGP